MRWIRNARDANLPVSGPLICVQDERFAAKMNTEEFKASEGWLAHFKCRHNLTFKSVRRKSWRGRSHRQGVAERRAS